MVIENSKIGLIALSNRDEDKDLLDADKTIYENFYSNIFSFQFESKEELVHTIREHKFDLLHLIVTFDKDGNVKFVEDNSLEIKSIVEILSDSPIKILLIASDNLPDVYINGVNPNIIKSDVIMTLNRKGDSFKSFYIKLFDQIKSGKPLGDAWTELAPQDPNIRHENTPESIMTLGSKNIVLK